MYSHNIGKLFVLLTLLVFNSLFNSVKAAEQKQFNCVEAISGPADQQYKSAQELMLHSYDTAKLACGVKHIISRADANNTDFDAQLMALKANARNIYYLDRIVLYELGYLISWYVTEVPEETKTNASMLALLAAQSEQLRIIKRARDSGFKQTELDYFEGQTLGPTAKALPLLKAAVASDAKRLQGEAEALLAKIYYALPDIVGGDLDLAISSMRSAWSMAPENPRFPRLLAGYLIDQSKQDEALAVLKKMLTIKVNKEGMQLMSDQLRVAADLATRIAENDLAKQLSDRRDAMLNEFPFLQKRTVVSAMGHFGDKDPMDNQD